MSETVTAAVAAIRAARRNRDDGAETAAWAELARLSPAFAAEASGELRFDAVVASRGEVGPLVRAAQNGDWSAVCALADLLEEEETECCEEDARSLRSHVLDAPAVSREDVLAAIRRALNSLP